MTALPQAAADTLLVTEVFSTIQGEGPAAGRPATFIRTGGCNLSCNFCDTPYTWDASRFDLRQEMARRPVDSILEAVDTPIAVITGGEPLLHQKSEGWDRLLAGLVQADKQIHIETNGTMAPSRRTASMVTLAVVSPKQEHADAGSRTGADPWRPDVLAEWAVAGPAGSVDPQGRRPHRSRLRGRAHGGRPGRLADERGVAHARGGGRGHVAVPVAHGRGVRRRPRGQRHPPAACAGLGRGTGTLMARLPDHAFDCPCCNGPGHRDAAAGQAVQALLDTFGVPHDEHTAETPARVARAFRELLSGYEEDPGEHLERRFPGPEDAGLVALQGIRFTSLCAHHLLPFTGTATVCYMPTPGSPIVGLSKLARVLEGYARRLQTQEVLGAQVADELDKRLSPMGAAVIITAHHGCMGIRGVRQPDALMTTSSLRGVFRTQPESRAELMALHETGMRR